MNKLLHCLAVVILLTVSWWAPSRSRAADTGLQDAKDQVLHQLREKYAHQPIRAWGVRRLQLQAVLSKMQDNGRFTDLDVKQKPVIGDKEDSAQRILGRTEQTAFKRLWRVAESLRGKPENDHPQRREALMRGVIHYATIEANRPDGKFRFHPSCFGIPTASVNIYFCLMPTMEAVEAGNSPSPLATKAHAALLAMAMQAWTQPKRFDKTDKNPVQVARFRHHVWWVGANGLTYRPVFYAALALRRTDMIDVLAKVAHGALGSAVSYDTRKTAFWEEGMTVDGAGWGHTRQTILFGYPFQGTGSALTLIDTLKGTPWASPVSAQGIENVMNLLRGSSWYVRHHYWPPILGRMNMVYGTSAKPHKNPGVDLAEKLLKTCPDELTDAQRSELQWYIQHGQPGASFADPKDPREGYTGVRYFWNQDDLVAKNADFSFIIDMASSRADGIESASSMAAGYNFFTNDGQTLFLRQGNELGLALGGSDLTALPGITARTIDHPFKPIENWRGFNSKYNFAGGVASGDDGCAGFIFEKHTGYKIPYVNDQVRLNDPNRGIYGVHAVKGYFIMGNTLVALGADIRDVRPEFGGHIRTSIEQTIWQGPVRIVDAKGEVRTIQHKSTPQPIRFTLSTAASKSLPQVSQHGFTYIPSLGEDDGNTITLELATRDAKWKTLAPPNRKAKTPATVDMLELTIDHGKAPRQGAYAYAVQFNPKDRVLQRSDLPMILANSADLQAIQTRDGNVIQAVFYDAGAILRTHAFRLQVSKPAVLMMERQQAGWRVTISDPRQDLSTNEITVTLTPTTHAGEKQDAISLPIALPTGSHRGDAATATLSTNN